MFAERIDYEGFAQQQGMNTSGYAAHSMPSRGYAAIWADVSRLGDTATPEGIQPLQGFVGAEGQAKRLRLGYETGAVGSVERLIALGPGELDSTPNSYDYEQSTLLVRYLLLDPELGPRFRAFLVEISTGSTCTPALLEQHLGVDTAELDRRLQDWLETAA